MECLKNCCRNLTRKKQHEHETQVITMKLPAPVPVKQQPVERSAVPEDYLLSKLPVDGRVVPFVLPTVKTSYVQPRGQMFPNLQPGLQSSARCTYAERKAELLASTTYSPESNLRLVQMNEHNSPGSLRRKTIKNRHAQSPKGAVLKPSEQKLSSSMFDLSAPQSHMQRFDSSSSVFSSESSMKDSIESLDSITLSGDERELGKVCVHVSYQEALEQVWITLVQCSDLCLTLDGGEQQKIGIKGIITVSKPIQFKSSVKTYQQEVTFMETFVFAMRLQQLCCSALVLRLQSHSSRKRTVAECVLSLRTLCPTETEHWLELHTPSKSSMYHSEVHLSTCFQPVNGRIQLQIHKVQNLPPSSSPLTQVFFVKAELQQCDRVLMKRKTKALKASAGVCEWRDTGHFQLESLEQPCSLNVRLYSRSSVRRKQCLGQILLGLDSPVPEAVDQWKDTMVHPEKVVTAWHRLSPP
ncbi:unnamed protein product [Knipowitschia caucasica]|uniref:C2 domain-containing protein n=2 Tax=Knipowitschia caucasica TaxID=637954 RepID=A0AAV2JDN3_KNICA